MSRIMAEVTIVPLGTGSPSISSFVAEMERELRAFPSVRFMLTPMATVLEGEWEDVMAAVRRMHEANFRLGAVRVSTRLAIDERRDRETSMEAKLAAVESRLR